MRQRELEGVFDSPRTEASYKRIGDEPLGKDLIRALGRPNKRARGPSDPKAVAAKKAAFLKKAASGDAALIKELKASTDAKLTLESSSYIGNDLSFEIAYAGLPAESRVSVYVFEQPAKGAPFSQRAELARFETLSGTGTLVSEASVQAACTPVAFRYDVYVDGALANSFDSAGGEGGQTAC